MSAVSPGESVDILQDYSAPYPRPYKLERPRGPCPGQSKAVLTYKDVSSCTTFLAHSTVL